jgi:hypothetical protein
LSFGTLDPGIASRRARWPTAQPRKPPAFSRVQANNAEGAQQIFLSTENLQTLAE